MSGAPPEFARNRTAPDDAVEQFMRSFVDQAREKVAQGGEQRLSEPTETDDFEGARRLWHRLDSPDVRERLVAPGDREPHIGSDAYTKWLRTSEPKRFEPRARRSMLFALVACMGTFVLFTILRYAPEFLHRFSAFQPLQKYSTDYAHTKTLRLSDGSSVTLSASTQLSLRYGSSRRVIFLEHGEALFDVGRDPNRPFVVVAGAGSITALGTQFDVRRERDALDRVIVTVRDGGVEVAPSPKGASFETPTIGANASVTWGPAQIVVGQQMSYDRAGPDGAIVAVDVNTAFAWLDGRLEYRETPLAQVIPRVSRYSEKPIVLADEVVGDLPFSGIIFVSQVGEWRRALQMAYPLEVQEHADRFVIRSRSEKNRT